MFVLEGSLAELAETLAALSQDHGKRASPPSHISTTKTLRGNKAWAKPVWWSGPAQVIGLAHLIWEDPETRDIQRYLPLSFARHVYKEPLQSCSRQNEDDD